MGEASKGWEGFLLLLLLCIVEGDVASLSCADMDGILDGYDEYSSVSYLASVCGSLDGLDGFLHILLSYNNGDEDSLNGTCVVDNATVDAGLAGFANTSDIVV